MSRDPRTMVRLLNDGAPTISSRFGRAWDRSRFSLEAGDPNDWMATAASWVVSSSCFHPFWDAWNVYAVSLKEIPGVRAATKQFPEADWEIGIYAIEPETVVDLSNPKVSTSPLEPLDLMCQIGPLSVDHVRTIVSEMVLLMVEQGLSPDQDNRASWQAFIVRRTAELITQEQS